MTYSCVPIEAPDTRMTLTIHRQLEIIFPDDGSWSDFLGCPFQCVGLCRTGTSSVPHLCLALMNPDPGKFPELFLQDCVISHSRCSPRPAAWLN